MRIYPSILLIGLFLLTLGFSTSISANFARSYDTKKIPVIISTDMAQDDWVAILYLLKQARFKITAIVVTGDGLAHCSFGAKHALGLLAFAKQSKVPVACGQAMPLRGHSFFPAIYREHIDHISVPLPHNPYPISKLSAVELLKQSLLMQPRKSIILSLAPLTDIAKLFLEYPEIKTHIQGIYMMGGAVNVPGNIRDLDPQSTNKAAEWNIYVDPYAASIVMSSGVPIVLVPLDATNQARLDQDFYTQLKSQRCKPASNLVYQLLFDTHYNFPYLFDAVAAVTLAHSDFYTLKHLRIKVLQNKADKMGATVRDNRYGSPINMVGKVDDKLFEKHLLAGLDKN